MKQLAFFWRTSVHYCHWSAIWLFRKQTFLTIIALLLTTLQRFAQVKTVTGTVQESNLQSPLVSTRILL